MALTILSMAIVIFLHYRKSKFCGGYRFSNIVKIVLFISDVQHYIQIKLCKTSGSLHTLKPEDIKLNEDRWSNVHLTPSVIYNKIKPKWYILGHKIEKLPCVNKNLLACLQQGQVTPICSSFSPTHECYLKDCMLETTWGYWLYTFIQGFNLIYGKRPERGISL